jgi:hypothetical protein
MPDQSIFEDHSQDEPAEQPGPKRVPGPNDGMIQAEHEEREMTEEEEQALRDFYGYAKTETRTKAERDAAAARMITKAKIPDESLPPDLEKVWGQERLDSSGQSAAQTAAILIEAWGEEEFRRSAIHRMALEEHSRVRESQLRVLEFPCPFDTPKGQVCKLCGKKH